MDTAVKPVQNWSGTTETLACLFSPPIQRCLSPETKILDDPPPTYSVKMTHV